MGYSEETPNYHLPQYIGGDRPSYLGDWNGAMGIIDGAMNKNKQDIADNAVKIANVQVYVDNSITTLTNTVNGKINTLTEHVNTEVTNLTNYVNTKVDSVKTQYKNVLCIGDSFASNTSTSWVEKLCENLTDYYTSQDYDPVVLYKYAQGGAGFVQKNANKNFQTLLAQAYNENPTVEFDLIVIAGGINDPITGVSFNEIIGNMISTITSGQTKRPDVFVFHNLWGNKGYNLVYENYSNDLLANARWFTPVVGCWTWFYDLLESDGYTQTDRMHPTPKGSAAIGANMFTTILFGADHTVNEYSIPQSLINGSGGTCFTDSRRDYMTVYVTYGNYSPGSGNTILVDSRYAMEQTFTVGVGMDAKTFGIKYNPDANGLYVQPQMGVANAAYGTHSARIRSQYF